MTDFYSCARLSLSFKHLTFHGKTPVFRVFFDSDPSSETVPTMVIERFKAIFFMTGFRTHVFYLHGDAPFLPVRPKLTPQNLALPNPRCFQTWFGLFALGCLHLETYLDYTETCCIHFEHF